MQFRCYELEVESPMVLPTLVAKVVAGNQRYIAPALTKVDLNALVTGGKPNHLLLNVEGDSMDGVINDGEWVIVSRDREPRDNDLVIAMLNDECTVKRHQLKHDGRNGLFLVPANGDYEPIEVTEHDEYEILGVVVWILKQP